MAVTSDDDVQDGDTTAAGIAPATSAADEEDRTVQQPPDSRRADAVRRATNAQPAPQRPPPMMTRPANATSKKMTFVGLAPPAAASAPGATSPPPPAAGPAERPAPSSRTPALPSKKPVATAPKSAAAGAKQSEAEEEDASITATAVAPTPPRMASSTKSATPPASARPASKSPIGKASIPLANVPSSVQIREMPPPQVAVPKVGAALEEPLDETEVRTVVSGPPDGKPPAVPAAALGGKSGAVEPIEADDVEEELEDSVTTQAPSAIHGGRLPEEDEPKTSPPLRLPPPIPAAGRSPFDDPPIPSPAAAAAANAPAPWEDEDAYNVEDSVTTRGPAVPDFRLDDSVTADAPVAEPPGSTGAWSPPAKSSRGAGPALPPAIEDGTEGTTRGLAKRPPPRPGGPLPGAQTMPSAASPLRVVGPSALASPPVLVPATGGSSDPIIGDDEVDDDIENGTAVMVGAPVKPAGAPQPLPAAGARAARPAVMGGAGGARAQATALSPGMREPSSDSGLRVAAHESQPLPPMQEQASLGAMMQGALVQQHGVASDRGSGVAPREYPSQPFVPLNAQMHYPQSEPSMALGATIPANHAMLQGAHHPGINPHPQPLMQQYDFASSIKKPRYGLLVGLVALLSFAIPLVLFLWLHKGGGGAAEGFSRTPTEVGNDTVGPDTHKNTRVVPAPSASHGKKDPKRR